MNSPVIFVFVLYSCFWQGDVSNNFKLSIHFIRDNSLFTANKFWDLPHNSYSFVSSFNTTWMQSPKIRSWLNELRKHINNRNVLDRLICIILQFECFFSNSYSLGKNIIHNKS